jgi:type II secretory pathway component GspD/PulD (secretin)
LAQDQQAAETAAPPAPLLMKPVDFNFEATPLCDVVNYLKTVTNLNIVLDPNMKDPKVREKLITLKLTDVGLGNALDIILGKSLGYRVKDDVIVITDVEKPTPFPQNCDEEAKLLVALKEEKVDVEFKDAPLEDVVAYLVKLANINIVLDPDVTDFQVRGRLITLSLKQVSLGAALDLIAGKDLEYVIKGNIIVIKEAFPALVLMKRVSLNFDWAPLSDVMDYLKPVTGTNIVFDPYMNDPDFKDRYVSLKLTDVSLANAFDIILGDSLSYRVKDGVMVITDTEKPTPWHEDAAEEANLGHLLTEKKVDLEFEATPLEDIVHSLAERAGVNLILDSRVVQRARLITLSVRQASLGTALDLIVGKDLEHVIKGNVIVITEKQGK